MTTATMTPTEFVDRYYLAIADAVLDNCPPVYDAEQRKSTAIDVRRLKRKPMLAQADAIRAGVLSVKRNTLTTLVGEMGTGKSMMGAAISYLAGCKATLLMVPPHLTRKWLDEIHLAVPGSRALIAKSPEDLRKLPGKKSLSRLSPLFVVVSQSKAKLSYNWRAATVKRWYKAEGRLVRNKEGLRLRVECCATCYAPQIDKEGIPIGLDRLEDKRMKCRAPVVKPNGKIRECGGALWSADRDGARRRALADVIKLDMKDYFDLFIVDEVHEEKGATTAQGFAAATLAQACGRTLALTGTLLGGYASNLFHLLYRFDSKVRGEFQHDEDQRWIRRYGFLERITTPAKDGADDFQSGRASKRQTKRVTYKERPGVTPHLLYQLIGNTIFVRLADVANNLPAYHEEVVAVDMQGEGLHGDAFSTSQAGYYTQLADDLRAAVKAALALGSKRLLGAYVQALLSWPDACFREERVIDKYREPPEQVAYAPAMPWGVVYPKEQKLLDLIKAERAEGRRVCVYVTHTGSRDMIERYEWLLRTHGGFRVASLRQNTTKPENRMDWIRRQCQLGNDVLLTNPRLVQTGLDLIEYPTLVWAEIDISTFVLRQASRRSWRIGQRLPVKVIFMVYSQTLQADFLALMAKKLRASLMVEGEIPEAGLATQGVSDDDVMVVLARKLATGIGLDSRSLEALFAANREAEQRDESLVIDAQYQEVETPATPAEVKATQVVVQAAPVLVEAVQAQPIPAEFAELGPLFAHLGDGLVTGPVAVTVQRKRGQRVVRGPRDGIAQLGLFDL